jgi:serine/threonine protein kinase
MEIILGILAAVGTAAGAISSTYTVTGIVVKHLREWARGQKTSRVLEFMDKLGLRTEAEVRQAVDNWSAPKGFTEENKRELVTLLTNLVRGARFHSTNGTPLSSYMRCEHLIEQLLQNVQPRRRAGEKIESWQLKAFLGMGSFGEVWRAENPLYPESRVYKFFTREGARDWLRREAGALMAVRGCLADNPNVVEYLDVAIDAEPYPYIALGYAEKGSLEDWILRRPDDRFALNPTEVMRGIVRGVAEAHRHNIYHRDLKPANVLLTGDGEPIPKVADFGLSTVETKAESQSSLRSEMVLVGTRTYHPPEASDPFKKRYPAQDDVFALGVIWYQLLTSELMRPPYDFVERLSSTTGVDSRTVKMISRCLAHPDRRYPTASELFADLDVDAPPGPGEWTVPAGCFEVAGIAREYLEQRMR